MTFKPCKFSSCYNSLNSTLVACVCAGPPEASDLPDFFIGSLRTSAAAGMLAWWGNVRCEHRHFAIQTHYPHLIQFDSIEVLRSPGAMAVQKCVLWLILGCLAAAICGEASYSACHLCMSGDCCNATISHNAGRCRIASIATDVMVAQAPGRPMWFSLGDGIFRC